MARPITSKEIQHHIHCKCGYNEVDHSREKVGYKLFKNYNIKRKKDNKTGLYFFLRELFYDNCFSCTPDLN